MANQPTREIVANALSTSRLPRVLHCVGAMNLGGVESWLMHLLRQRDQRPFDLDILVHSREDGAFDEEVRSLGGRILRIPDYRSPWYGHRLRRLLNRNGPFTAVHSHLHYFSGIILRNACRAGVPVRIAHSHTDSRTADSAAGFLRKCYLAHCSRLIARYATHCIGCSEHAAAALFGQGWRARGDVKIMYCAIDMEPFALNVNKRAVRAEFGVPADAPLVVGHVGRFTAEKNHAFLIETFVALSRLVPGSNLVLVGDGPLRRQVEERARAAGVGEHVRFLGRQFDIPRILRGLFDVFVMPSLWEGLPLVCLEAQAAGVPIVLSDAVADEVVQVPSLVSRASLGLGAAVWAERIAKVAVEPRPDCGTALSIMRSSEFSVTRSISSLTSLYCGADLAGRPIRSACQKDRVC